MLSEQIHHGKKFEKVPRPAMEGEDGDSVRLLREETNEVDIVLFSIVVFNRSSPMWKGVDMSFLLPPRVFGC